MSVKNHSNPSLEKIADDFLKEYGQGKHDGRSLLVEWVIESLGYHIFPIPGLAAIA